MKKYLLILRGPSGAGKSTYAKRAIKKFSGIFKRTALICSADDHFVYPNGIYRFDKNELGKAHCYCQWLANVSMLNHVRLVVIDNTNTNQSDIKLYEEMAKKHHYIVKYKIIGGQTEEDIKLYVLRNTHGVSEEHIRKMARRLSNSIKSMS